MPELHADIMRILLEYFDAQTWAKLAQVCTTWKALAYRPAVWQALEWKPRQGHEDILLDSFPRNARHIGEPSTLCFHAWVNRILVQEDFRLLPKQIVYETDPVKKRNALQSYWSNHRKPCVHAHHHVWTDVLRARGYIQTMTKPELQRLYFRIVDDPPPTCDANPYRLFLQHRSQDCETYAVHTSWICPLAHAGAHPTQSNPDVLQNLRQTILQEQCQLHDLCRTNRHRSMRAYERSADALRKYTPSHFHDNAQRYRRQWREMLDAVGFT